MRDIKIKLSSNYQQLELTLDSLDEDLSEAIELVNYLGEAINNSDAPAKKSVKKASTPSKAQEKEFEPATESQIRILRRYGVENAETYSKTRAWKKIGELKK